MIVLAIDTCGPSGSIALGRVESGRISVLGEAQLPGKTYAAQLVPATRDLLKFHNLSTASLNAIVIVNGPGSFTGIRIGVSSAKGFAEALDIPLLALSRLAILAAKANTGSAALDAGRGEFYFRDHGREFLAKPAPAPTSGTLAICEPAALQHFPAAILVEPPSAADALNFALPQLIARDFADVATLDGNYLRRSDAEIFAKSAGKI
ncbi:MAG TPA: tRNA (adenosine(37)-N6)-threonylcarbamoyltransferase complex dimerization subunit type 1 TsaB [Silvibacterium sp.]|nr:tRNA (adenosine(37)-N6)-threonylcarbamoyltransferase complex dimerization subunit type 1 TsaB [Silvibacterium sp.]